MSKVCYNPFDKPNHGFVRKNLRNVSPFMANLTGVPVESCRDLKICSSCRIELFKRKKNNDKNNTLAEAGTSSPVLFEDSQNDHILSQISNITSTKSITNESQSTTSEITQSQRREVLQHLNESLKCAGQSPVKTTKMKSLGYRKKKINKVHRVMQKKVFKVTPENKNADIIADLKEKFKASTKRSEKVQILTLVVKHWTKKKIMDEFKASDYMIRKAKQLVEEKGILSTPNPSSGKPLLLENAVLIQNFYRQDDVSRVMPGRKDCVTVRSGGLKLKIQKRLLLANLKELYQLFKKENPTVEVHFSKFASLRPPECIIAGSAGTHSVCVCTYHQNVKLQIENSRLKYVTRNRKSPLQTYTDCMNEIMCTTATEECCFQTCKNCPDTEVFFEKLKEEFELECIDEITYQQWTQTDRTSLITIQQSIDEFLTDFESKLVVLMAHDYVTKKQASFLKNLKPGLKSNEIAVICDFSENYTFIQQDEVQSYHWSKQQATLHIFVVYYKNEKNELKNLSYAIISDNLSHNTAAVSLHQKRLIDFLKTKLNFEKIFYFSDGAASQYKNRKNFLNLCLHKLDYDIDAEWHFFSTSHGKGPCDGVGGTIKRLAAKASLQNVYLNKISNPKQLFNWCIKNIEGIFFCYVSSEEQEDHTANMDNRFQTASPRTIPGTRSYHAYVPLDSKTVCAKKCSIDAEGVSYKLTD